MPTYLRALDSRNYRLYFIGQLISLAGTWMQQIAMSWLAYRLSNSAFVLGMIGFASQIPILLLAPLGGVLIDRFDRRRLLLATQALSLVQALVLALLTWQEWIGPGLMVAMAFVLGCINALDMPARQTVAVQLVDDPADLANAIALNSFLMNAARFVGPALAGIIVAATGEALCFLLNALSYLAVLAALAALRIAPRPAPGRQLGALASLRDGYRYVRQHRQIGLTVLLVACVSFFATPYAVMMPLIAREIFGGDASTYGHLIASAGVGSLLASVFLATREDTAELHRWIGRAAPGVGICLALFAFVPSYRLAIPVLVVLGFAIIFVIAGSNTLIQTQVDDNYRGRVMAIFSMAFLGIAPLGSLAVGSLAHGLDIRLVLAACGACTLLAGLAYGYKTRHRSAAADDAPSP